ncbi:MAG: GNAT family N-acetyltransferase [Bacteroidales bacterium]|jgi:GNAT superfamily N-acetyltransferase|nr:GNAT family N-acetyltransferase [Bacteroidales bacterium]
MENIRIERRRLTVDEYQYLRGTTNWFKIEDKAVEKSIDNELFSVCVYDGQKIVGMGRIVGDGAIYFYIQDIIVIPSYQGKGLGVRIMNEIETFLLENAYNNSFIGLMAADGVHEFYLKFGYEKRDDKKPGMSKLMKK